MRPHQEAGRPAVRRPENGAGGAVAWMLMSFLGALAMVAGLSGTAVAIPSNAGEEGSHVWRVADLWAQPRPYAQGHRGYGANEFDASPPVENSLDGFHTAFRNGIRVVELDLQRTADGKVVVIHDDAVPGGRCIGTLTYDELLAVHPEVPLFRTVLNSDRHFASDDCVNGIIFAEIKAPIPACNADTTSALAAATESALVAAVIADIRQARMEDQVCINSGSPSILHQASIQAPEIQRALSLNILQLLPPSAIPGMTGYTVRRIPRDDCGLDWYEVSNIARLPTFYPSQAGQPAAFQRFVTTTVGCAGAKAVSLDKLVLLSNPAAAPTLISALHSFGLEVVVWTVDTQQEWAVVAGAGADGITTDNVAMGVQLQAAATCAVADRMARGNGRFGREAAPAGLALEMANAAGSGSLAVAFSLPDNQSAKLSLVDVAGRLIDSREVGSLGSGRHTVNLGNHLPKGMYFVRLTHDRDEARMKTTVLR